MNLKQFIANLIMQQKLTCRMSTNCAECAAKRSIECFADAAALLILKELRRSLDLGVDLESLIRKEVPKS